MVNHLFKLVIPSNFFHEMVRFTPGIICVPDAYLRLFLVADDVVVVVVVTVTPFFVVFLVVVFLVAIICFFVSYHLFSCSLPKVL